MRDPAVKKACNDRWRAANPDKVRASTAKFKAANREKVRADGREYARKNREKCSAAFAEWRAKNPGKMAEYAAAWRARNPEKARTARLVSKAKYRARLVNAPGSHTYQDVLDCLRLQGWRCFYCLASLLSGYHVDHMTPLARGGSNGPENIVCACSRCNHRKHAKTAAEFILGALWL